MHVEEKEAKPAGTLTEPVSEPLPPIDPIVLLPAVKLVVPLDVDRGKRLGSVRIEDGGRRHGDAAL